jgi:hypothetical protein
LSTTRNRDSHPRLGRENNHHLTICSESHFQTEVESGKITGGTNTSRLSSSIGAVATREMIEKIMVVNNFMIVNQPVKF